MKKKNLKIFKTCEICHSQNITIFTNYGRIGSNYMYGKLPVFLCINCGHKFLNPRKTNSYYINYYQNFYRNNKNNNVMISKDYVTSQLYRGKKIYNFFKKKIKLKSGNILDHGCAMGLTMQAWINNKWVATGIDPNKASINYAKKIFSYEILQYYGENLPTFKKKFDVILSLGSLEHSFDINKTLKKININTKPNSYLIIRWRSNKLIGSPLEYFNHNHFRYFSKDSWKVLLYKHGFSSIKFFNTKIEDNHGYEYILSKKNKKKINYIPKLSNEKIYLSNYINKYKKLSKIIHNLKQKGSLNTLEQKINFLKKKKIGLINKISNKKSVNRFFLETFHYLKFINNLNN